MIRRYLPRRTPVAPSMARELQETVDETDNRPMRVLGCRTPPPRHSPTNRQNQPRTRMLHLQIDNGLDKLRASSLLSLIQYEIYSYARITRRSRRSSLHFPSTT